MLVGLKNMDQKDGRKTCLLTNVVDPSLGILAGVAWAKAR